MKQKSKRNPKVANHFEHRALVKNTNYKEVGSIMTADMHMVKQGRDHNYALDGLKILFMLIITMHHSLYFEEQLLFGYMGVEFFFMTSGYMLMRTAVTKSQMNVGMYALTRFKKLYPHYLFSFLLMFIANVVRGSENVSLWKSIPEILMIQNLGIFSGGMNYPCWYISVLFYCCIALFAMQKYLPKGLFWGLGSCCILFTYPFILFNMNGVMETFDTIGIFYLPVWRGLAGLLVGMAIYLIHKKIDYSKYQCSSIATEAISLIGVILLMCIPGKKDGLILLMLILLMLSVGNPHSWIARLSRSRLISPIFKYEYAIYLNHALVLGVFNTIIAPRLNIVPVLKFLIVWVLLVIYSVMTTKFVERVYFFLDRHNKKHYTG